MKHTVESLQYHCIHYTVPLVQGYTRLLPIMMDLGSIPRGVLMWNLDSPVSVVSLHWWPNVIDHCGLVWGRLRLEPSLGHRADNVIIPLDLTQPFCPGFMLAAGPPSGFTTDIGGCWGGALRRACNLTASTTQFQWSSGPPVCFSSLGTWVQSPGGYLCETWIALSRYNTDKNTHTDPASQQLDQQKKFLN
jgi:hypothetical protein